MVWCGRVCLVTSDRPGKSEHVMSTVDAINCVPIHSKLASAYEDREGHKTSERRHSDTCKGPQDVTNVMCAQ
jgi:hypothetical protein